MTVTIIRARRRERFVVLNQRAVEDTRLSWAARGLLAYLLSRPDDWRVMVNDLQRRGDLGRDGIYRLLHELRSAGYVVFTRVRDPEGRIACARYLVSEIPGEPLPALPDLAQPDLAQPDPAEPDVLPNTEDHPIQKITKYSPLPYHPSGGAEGAELEFPARLSSLERRQAESLVKRLSSTVAQQVLDELAGIIAAGRLRASPVACLRGLVERARAGAFTQALGIQVAERRAALARTNAAAVAAAACTLDAAPIDPSNPLVQRVLQMAQRDHRPSAEDDQNAND